MKYLSPYFVCTTNGCTNECAFDQNICEECAWQKEFFARAHDALLPGDHIVGNALHVACRDGEWVPTATTRETSG